MVVKVSYPSKKLVIDSFQVALSSICIGVLSVLMPVVGARVLEAPQLSMLLSSWALVNTIQFGLLSPIESFAPRYRASAIAIGQSDHQVANFFKRYALVASGVAAFILLLFLLAMSEKSSDQLIAGALFFIFSSGLLASQRSLLVAQGKFKSILKKNIVVATAGLASFALIVVTSWSYVGAVYLAFGIANTAGYIVERLGEKAPVTTSEFDDSKNYNKVKSKSFEIAQLSRIGILSLTSISTLLLTNGTIIASKLWNVDSNFIVSYSAALNLALVLFVLLNSITPPIYNKAIKYYEAGLHQELKILFLKTLFGFSIATLAISSSLSFVGPWALKLYIGDSYAITKGEFFFIAIGEGIATLTVVPKVFLMAINRDRILFPIWAGGIGLFVLLFIEINNKKSSMIFVPILAASAIAVLAVLVFFKSMASPRGKTIVTTS